MKRKDVSILDKIIRPRRFCIKIIKLIKF